MQVQHIPYMLIHLCISVFLVTFRSASRNVMSRWCGTRGASDKTGTLRFEDSQSTRSLCTQSHTCLNTYFPPIPLTLCLFLLLLIWVIFHIITSASLSFQTAVVAVTTERQTDRQTDGSPGLDKRVEWALGGPSTDSQYRGVQSVRQSFSLCLLCRSRFAETLTRC